jgi:hypothetical protein
MDCRYCKRSVESYERGRIIATFDRWGYNTTLRVCGCKGIDPLNRDPEARRAYVVYNEHGQVCNVSPYTDSMMQTAASMSEDMVYRYKLSRIWNPLGRKILFIMINPSTATATETDRTINRLLEITKLWGYDGFHVGNLYPYRSSKPADLKTIQIPPEVHDRNVESIAEMAADSSLVVYAWGTKGPDERQQEPAWLRSIMNRTVHCIGRSVKGVPKHPNQWGPNVTPDPPHPIPFRSAVVSPS